MQGDPTKQGYGDQPPPYQPPQAAYPVQQSGSYPVHHATTTTTVVTQPNATVIMPIMFGAYPMNMTCTHCQMNIVTTVEYKSGALTWLLCGGIAFVGGWMGCCFIPFCIDSVKDALHSCPNCNNFLGTYHRI